jgi:hypothetical protein
MGNNKKYFSKNKFWYGYKGEMLFQQLVPKCKKQSKQADFKYKDLQVEIGRSKQVTNKRFKVYYRKLFYNINKEHHKFLKSKSPFQVRDFTIQHKNDKKYNLVDFDKFIFIYFTNSLKKCAIYTFDDVMNCELKKGYKNEYYFDMKVKHLYNVLEIPKILEEFSNSDNIENTEDIDWGEMELC